VLRQFNAVRIEDCLWTQLDLLSRIQEAAMTSSDNISLMKRWYREVWRERNDNTIRELLAPDARLWGQLGPDQEIRGPEGFIAFAQQIRNAFPDTDLIVEDAFAMADKVAVRWTAIGTHTGDNLGVRATGKRIRITGITIARIESGRIVEGWDNWDRLGMLEQIGAYTSPESVTLEKSA
jgi:steroid delta-isomerase-like uncharacterized protein